jgi:hypothetical protein
LPIRPDLLRVSAQRREVLLVKMKTAAIAFLGIRDVRMPSSDLRCMSGQRQICMREKTMALVFPDVRELGLLDSYILRVCA